MIKTNLKNNKFLNKSELYLMIDMLRKHLNLPQNYIPLDSVALAHRVCKNPIIEQLNFETTSICGMLYVGEKTTTIGLNVNRTKEMQNFDCCHELIHYFCHDIKECQCVCSEISSSTKSITQSPLWEWQANEGAAEFLIPYRTFIPTYVALSRKYARDFIKTPPEKELAKIYNVTETVIRNRIDTLNYEIYQYLSHGNINNIQILSSRKQKTIGFNESHKKQYCTNCLSPVNDDYEYCPVCGTHLIRKGTAKYKYILKGAGYMKYPGVELNENMRPVECPNCANEEIANDANYCIICGKALINHCSDIYEDCSHSDQPLPGNARYCPYCGSPTTYLNYNVIDEYTKFNQSLHTTIDYEMPF